MNDNVSMYGYALVVKWRLPLPLAIDQTATDKSLKEAPGFMGYDDKEGRRFYFFMSAEHRQKAMLNEINMAEYGLLIDDLSLLKDPVKFNYGKRPKRYSTNLTQRSISTWMFVPLRRTQNAKYSSQKNKTVYPKNGGGAVWCNPPYSQVGAWVRKAYDSVQYGDADRVVMLLPARTDTKWFHDYIYPRKAHVEFIRGRLKFSGAKNNAPFPSMIVVF